MIITKGILIILLVICSIEDIRKKVVHLPTVFCFSIVGLLLQYYQRNENIWSILGGMGIGVFVLFLSYITKGGVGNGDGILLITTGIYLGLKNNLLLFIIAVFGVSVWAFLLVIIKKISYRNEIPFIPFMLSAYMGMLFI
ncbi:prepilin peptidase [Anaerosacchariphilus polymeriproducens]|uniref:prepilin peptidase n=1 Tax=Anaerosacchariphilus polymeriproducens TaxID=1812858 RepID=UPI0013903E13|nr:prepilin peptidase [Anaerosacchariphilus polymeriproducens]